MALPPNCRHAWYDHLAMKIYRVLDFLSTAGLSRGTCGGGACERYEPSDD
jgi:hypothetical protein